MQLEPNRHSRNSIGSNASICSLPVRTSRPCSCLAFSFANPKILAAGFDKAKNEPGLVVWDLEAYPAVFSSAGRLQGPTTQGRASGSMKSDVAAKNYYATAESVSSVAFLPDSADLLVAGVANLSLRLYDLRAPGHKTQTAVPTKAGGIATDSFKSSLFASFGDSTVSIWDWRKLSYPLLSFTSIDASADGGYTHKGDVFTCAEFSQTRRGTLATLTRGDDSVRFWDIQNAPSMEIDHPSEAQRFRDGSRDGSRTSKLGRLSWSAPSLPWNAPADQSRVPANQASGSGSIILANTYHSACKRLSTMSELTTFTTAKSFSRGIASFALAPSTNSHPLTSNLVLVNPEGDIEFHTLHDAPKQSLWSSRGDLAVGSGTKYRIFPGYRVSEPHLEPWNIHYTTGNELQSEATEKRGGGKASRSQSRRVSPERPGFGRGDKDGFPALSAASKESTLTASMYLKSRQYSPSSPRRFPLDHSKLGDSIQSHDSGNQDNLHESIAQRPETTTLQLGSRTRRGDGSRSLSRNRKREPSHPGIIEKDISMTIRARVIAGYGLQNVGQCRYSCFHYSDATP